MRDVYIYSQGTQFSINDWKSNDEAINKEFDWLVRENKRAARATRSYEKHLWTDKQPRQTFVLFVLCLLFYLDETAWHKTIRKSDRTQYLRQSFHTSWGEEQSYIF